ncbi:hypothetical protein F4780DRAFT_780662 [Xylariomycetidae sp. FL0641]|nr:hypothetical protein F4780DRAFT_780662 [Xylariomycetidae sp. FL0641]
MEVPNEDYGLHYHGTYDMVTPEASNSHYGAIAPTFYPSPNPHSFDPTIGPPSGALPPAFYPLPSSHGFHPTIGLPSASSMYEYPYNLAPYPISQTSKSDRFTFVYEEPGDPLQLPHGITNIGSSQVAPPTASFSGNSADTPKTNACRKRKKPIAEAPDDPKPKRPMNTFMIFRRIMKDDRLANGEEKAGESIDSAVKVNWAKANGALSKTIATQYRGLDKTGELYQRCERLAAQDKRRFDEEMALWEQRNGGRPAKNPKNKAHDDRGELNNPGVERSE